LANLLDCCVYALVKLDESIRRPERLLQFLSRHNLTGALNQESKHLKGLFLELHPAAVLAQFTGSEIRFEQPETDALRSLQAGIHRIASMCCGL
jgi:hypothetical protein